MTTHQLHHFINGEHVPPDNGNYIPVDNPATGVTIAMQACGGVSELDRAVSAARRALNHRDWYNLSPLDRSRLLDQFADRLKTHLVELATLESQSSGGTIKRITGLDIPVAIDICQETAELIKTYPFVENLPAKLIPEITHTQVVKEPIGVCGLITPWNFPIALLLVKLIPALAAGNTVVIKPSELTPNTTLRIIEITADLLPKGVVNVVLGTGSDVGEAMALHPGIDKISFTGSTAVGKRIQINAAETLKRVTLELGGKSPAIVMPDADLNRVTLGALFGVMLNSGQMCESGTRLLVHESMYEALLTRLTEACATLQLGDPLAPNTTMGPMSSHAHGNKVLSYIDQAKAAGARIVCGGYRVEVTGCEGGFFIAPTVIADVLNDMPVAREEIFGPVLSVIKYQTLEEAITVANDCSYGLAAGIWSEDVVEAQKIARRLQAGSVWINDWHMMRSDAPFGGIKNSGYGREFGAAGLEAYLETKVVSTAFERSPAKKIFYPLLHNTLT